MVSGNGRKKTLVSRVDLTHPSMLQCLLATEVFSTYFRSLHWKREINQDNPLGMGGKVAEAYAGLNDEVSRFGEIGHGARLSTICIRSPPLEEIPRERIRRKGRYFHRTLKGRGGGEIHGNSQRSSLCFASRASPSLPMAFPPPPPSKRGRHDFVVFGRRWLESI